MNVDQLVEILWETDPDRFHIAQPVVYWLTARDLEDAFAVGDERLRQARAFSREQPQGDPGDDARRRIDRWSAASELAVSRYFRLPWQSLVENLHPKPPDVGDDIEVRWTGYPTGHLIMYEEDDPERRYILVRGELPDMVLAGWLRGSEAKLERWQNHAGARNADDYWVPQSALHGLDEWL